MQAPWIAIESPIATSARSRPPASIGDAHACVGAERPDGGDPADRGDYAGKHALIVRLAVRCDATVGHDLGTQPQVGADERPCRSSAAPGGPDRSATSGRLNIGCPWPSSDGAR